MSGNVKLAVTIVAIVVAGYLALNLVNAVLHTLVPLLLFGAVAYVIYNVATNRPILGGKRRYLP